LGEKLDENRGFWGDVANAAENALNPLQQAAQLVNTAKDALDGNSDAADENADATDSMAQSLVQASIDSALLDQKTANLSQAQEDNAATVKELTAAYDKQIQALRDKIQAQEDAIAATMSAIDSDLGYRNQVADTMAKVAESTLIQLDAKRTTEEHAQAARDAEGAIIAQADAAVQLAEDQATANGQTLSAEEKTRLYRDQLTFMSANLTGPTKAAIDGHIAALNLIPLDVSTRVTTKYGSTGSADYTQPGFGTRTNGGADGNPATRIHTGGVAGGEMFASNEVPAILEKGEVVLNKGQQSSVAAAMSGGGGNTINVYTNADPQAVVDALRRFVKRNGPIQGLSY